MGPTTRPSVHFYLMQSAAAIKGLMAS